MGIVRATQRLGRVLGVQLKPPVETPAPAESATTYKLGEWYANTVVSEIGSLVVFINAPTRLVLVSQALDVELLARDLPKRLKRLLGGLGVPADIAAHESSGLASLTFTKTADRRMLGSLNEVCLTIAQMDDDAKLRCSADLDAIENELADFIHLGMVEKHPTDALRSLLGASPSKRPALRLVHTSDPKLQVRTPAKASLRVASPDESSLYLPGPLTPDDTARLVRVPLRLESCGLWDPKDLAYDDPPALWPSWLKSVIAAGKRESFEMEAVGSELGGGGNDPIYDAIELAEAGKPKIAEAMLWRLIERDVRYLDAHAHIGNLAFDKRPGDALSHFLMGAHIGRQALKGTNRPVLPWLMLGNRPFLRCLHGVALCLWRLRRNDEAAQVLTDMLWLNPNDNQGSRFSLAHIEAGTAWSRDLD